MAGDLHVSVDAAVEAQASVVLAQLGLAVDDAVRLLLSRVADEKRLPFTPNAATQAAIEAGRRGEVQRFNTFDAMIAELHEDD